ncbi:DgaE family pyridoxal phosphate-dependent ammonia lyase [Marinilactibacillus sp. XAAS-LB27]|uniref:DgaE family pyridoxal phosphate-dependent ammonia lyase n=1 Tax=Marinilactibacillus sp. XAAS-LB27 TaxID=3114538 RepID=UPI002E17347E|nr:DgaE family pyridoxal phosphate-dependent ammonia lyase [Marinilactibacillus sp. XAAS-LB27]
MDYYKKYNLKKVINASGKMSILGVSIYSEETTSAQAFGSKHFFEMKQLVEHTGNHIAKLLGVESAYIVSSASAGIAQSVAGVIGKGSKAHVYDPYNPSLTNREIVIPKGHNVDYGTPVEVMVQIGGGKVVEAGYANMCSVDHIENKITDQTAAILYVKSHHTVQKSMLSITEAVEVAHKYNLPLIVDAAAEEDLKKYYELGADITIYSGAKAIEGPSSGVVLGKSNWIEKIKMQSDGIGRAMKIGKENILGLSEAIEAYLVNGAESGEGMKNRLDSFVKELNELIGIQAKIIQDTAGRDIYRAQMTVDGNQGLSAAQLVEELKQGDPAIYTRDYQKNNGIVEFDVRAVSSEDMQDIMVRMKALMK